MSEKVTHLARVAKVDHSEAIAAGLESTAQDIRAGKFAFRVERCGIVVMGKSAAGDDFAFAFYGADSSTAEVVGMLELAKLQVAVPHE